MSLRLLASFVVLFANPPADIAATRRIHAVVANGRLFGCAALVGLQRDVETRAAK